MAAGQASIRGDLLQLGQRSRSSTTRAAVRGALFGGVGEVIGRARGPWPVDTGFSRDQLDVEQDPPLTVHAVGRAPYTTKIVTRGGVRPWLEYVVEPLRQFAREDLPKMIADRLVKAMRSRVR